MNMLSRAARPAWRLAFLPSANLTATHLVVALSVLFLVTHLRSMAPGPGSVDAMNFAMGVQDFNVSEHRPHPPGYPVFVALGKITRPLIASSGPHADTVRDEARALAIWSVLFGAVAVFALFSVFRNIDQNDRRAAAATALTITCPLFWFLAIRPMSDVPGFGSALIAQAILFSAYRHQLQRQWREAMRATMGAAFISGLAIGLRSQTMWLTVP